MRFTYSSSEKLKSKTQIASLFKTGKSFTAYPVKLFFLKVDEQDVALKFAVAVPKRNIKKAVHRNTIKRLIREAYRLNKNEALTTLNQKYIVLILYLDKTVPSFYKLNKSVYSLLKLLINHDKTTY